MKILVALIILIILLLLYSVKIIYSLRLKNFDFSATLVLKTPFFFEVFNSKKKKKKKEAPIEKEPDKPKKKIKLDTLNQLKDPAFNAISQICKIIKKHCRIIKIETKAKTALEDPMENGIAFGVISGVLNVTTLILKEKCRIKDIKLEIFSDFNSGEGLIFESCGTLKVRPLLLVFVLLFNRKIIREIKKILDILKREDKENG